MKKKYYEWMISKIKKSTYYIRLRLFLLPIHSRIKGKKIIHFIHIGKTGGSALKSSLKNHTQGNHYYLFLHNHNIKLKHIPKGDKIIFFLRHPVSRFISAFNSKKRRNLGEGRYKHLGIEANFAKITSYFSTPSELAEALSSESTDLKNLALFALENIQHFKSVFDYLHSKKYVISRQSDIILIGYQETLSNDFNEIKKILNMPNQIQLISDELQAHKTPKHYSKKMSSLAISNIENYYKFDIEFYNFCRKSISFYEI